MDITAYVDADFAGLWGVEDSNDPVCVRSRTGYVLLVGGIPVIWASKLQTEIAVSTMMAEYIALSQAMREILPFRTLLTEVNKIIGLSDQKTTEIRCRVLEDNAGALSLANLELGRTTPGSKHFAVKYHWFRSQLIPGVIEVLKVDTHNQLADIFTKGLRKNPFEPLRKMLCGW